MDIQKKQAVWLKEKPLFEAEFIHSHLLPFFNFNENTGDYEIKSECVNNSDDEDRKVAYEALNTGWVMWLRAKKVAVPDGFVLVPKLSANFLFNIVPELEFKHQDQKDTVLYHLNYMTSEFKESAKKFVEEDHVKQKTMIEAQEKVV
ncbi:hypothetical protein [Acinetobacter sp. ANC 4558]|uniref:hypothetical protein n=1 Tax=Acinetobacter sp. ANC 4558 TaxID=1977876 RepID=UPI001D17261F|nr:hypothetical protein [Acinetobacter sp. ANC 4558]